MTRQLSLRACVFALCVIVAGAVSAAEWGDLTGRFVVDGTAPTPKKIDADKDQQVCAKHKLVQENVVVGPNGGLANAVVYLRTKKPTVHPDYAKTAKDKVVMDNHSCRFAPHVQIMRTSQTLVLKNSDPIGHNSKVDGFANPGLNVLIPAGKESEHKLTQEETTPVTVGCNIHTWMKGYLLVRNDPYNAISNEKGEFTIKNLPVGKELEFQLWQESAGYLKAAQIKGAKVDSKGRIKIKIKPGSNDLGDIKISPSAFK